MKRLLTVMAVAVSFGLVGSPPALADPMMCDSDGDEVCDAPYVDMSAWDRSDAWEADPNDILKQAQDLVRWCFYAATPDGGPMYSDDQCARAGGNYEISAVLHMICRARGGAACGTDPRTLPQSAWPDSAPYYPQGVLAPAPSGMAPDRTGVISAGKPPSASGPLPNNNGVTTIVHPQMTPSGVSSGGWDGGSGYC